MQVLVTGSKGFIGKNLIYRLKENKEYVINEFSKEHNLADLKEFIESSDFIIHLAGVNRPKENKEFQRSNVDLTNDLCGIVRKSNKKIPIVYASSTQASLENHYGNSKSKAEKLLLELQKDIRNPIFIYRYPGVFGKWSKPNYNSVVATFCHNIANDLEIKISDETAQIELVYIDDLVDDLLDLLSDTNRQKNDGYVPVNFSYKVKLGEIAKSINLFKESRSNLKTEEVGTGFLRALYSTYISFLPKEMFSYDLNPHVDERGLFSEVLRTKRSGQFSFFTAKPGVTRGVHYHHSKTEKFLVIKGKALFKFRNLITDEKHELVTSEKKLQIVESIPGWVHSITNIGEDDMYTMLWANETFNPENPDTITSEI